MDPLADLVALLRPQTLLWKYIEGQGSWSICFPSERQAHFGVVAAGCCELAFEDAPSVRLCQGDYVLLPSSRSYRFSSGADAPFLSSDEVFGASHDGRVSLGSGVGERCCLVGGKFSFAPANAGLLLEFLPDLVHIRSSDEGAERMQSLIKLIEGEASSTRPGRDLVLGRFVEIMLVEALRRPNALPGSQPKGLLGGLADVQLARALSALHADVQHAWTVGELASSVGLSRSAFSSRFHEALGSTPFDYLVKWRMALAKDRLLSGTQSIDSIANSVGYQSASAFSTAFSRVVGVPPGKFRCLPEPSQIKHVPSEQGLNG